VRLAVAVIEVKAVKDLAHEPVGGTATVDLAAKRRVELILENQAAALMYVGTP
jgi:hypothetical protein